MTDGIIQEVISNILKREFNATINNKSNYARLSKVIQRELIEKIKQEYQNDYWMRSNIEIMRKLIGDTK